MMALLVAAVLPPHHSADTAPSIRINTHWVGQGTTDTAHAYMLTFSDNGSYGFEVDMHHYNGLCGDQLQHHLGQRGRFPHGLAQIQHLPLLGR